MDDNNQDDWQEIPTAPAEPADDWEEVSNAPGSSMLDRAAGFGAGAGTGAAVGYGVKKGAQLLDKATPFIGHLSEQELEKITAQPKEYKAAAPMEQLIQEYKNLSEKTRQTSFDAARQAKDSLKDLPGWKPEKYFQTLAESLDKTMYGPADLDAMGKYVLEETQKQSGKLSKTNPAKIDAEIDATKKALSQVQEMGLESGKAAELERKLSELQQAKMSMGQNALNVGSDIQKKAAKKFQKEVIRIPEEVLKAKPELKSKALDEELSKALEKAVKKGRGLTEVPMTLLAEGILPALRDKSDLSGQPGSSFIDKFNTGLSETLRAKLGAENPVYDELMKKSSKAIQTQNLFEDAGIKYDKDAKSLDVNPNAVRKIIAEKETNPDKYERMIKALKGAEDVGVTTGSGPLLSGGQNAKLLQDMDLSAIKEQARTIAPTEYSRRKAAQTVTKALTGAATGAGVGGPVGFLGGLASGIGADIYGSRAQEAIALAKGGEGLGGAVLKIGKELPLIGLGLGGIVGAASANAAGFSPEQTAALATAEAANPVPFTDVVEAAKSVRDIPTEQLKSASETGIGFIPGGMPAQAAMVSGEALKGFTKPLRDLGGLAVEGLESAGTSRANDARSRMEQNLNAFRQLKQNNIPVTNQLNEFKSPVQAFQKDDLNNLAQEFRAMGGGAEGFAENLEKAARAEDEDARNRIIHGLSQQPGFRALMNRRNK